MRTPPDLSSEYDQKELALLKCEPWMVALIDLNPKYVFWGPHEDYMWKPGRDEPDFDQKLHTDHGWESRILAKTWADAPTMLDDLNEVVNFYFELRRDHVRCETCGGSGYHPDALWVADSFYRHSSPFVHSKTDHELAVELMMESFGCKKPEEVHERGKLPPEHVLSKYSPEFRAFCEEMLGGGRGCWNDQITQDEVDALAEYGRVKAGSTASEINLREQRDKGLDSHDAINRGILIEARCKRFGIPLHCTRCDGTGTQYTAENGHVGLVYWLLHPRKGASRGVDVEVIRKEELGEVFAFLKEAARRNAERFAKIPEPADRQ